MLLRAELTAQQEWTLKLYSSFSSALAVQIGDTADGVARTLAGGQHGSAVAPNPAPGVKIVAQDSNDGLAQREAAVVRITSTPLPGVNL
jgi:hypothetical protein